MLAFMAGCALVVGWQLPLGVSHTISVAQPVLVRARPPLADAGEMHRMPLTGRPLSTADTKGSSTTTLSVLKSISEVPSEEWDACVRASSDSGEPFLSYQYLHALESSGSVDPNEGWMVQHLVAHDKTTGRLTGAVPLYLKSHSYGEYVFDHAWARSYRASLSELSEPSAEAALHAVPAGDRNSYYPKLQGCVPFTPVAGARLLIAATEPLCRASMRGVLARGLVALANRLCVSSVHVTFSTREDGRALRAAGFLPRLGLQYHWHNDGYRTFEDYLASLKQSRRKAVRQERRKIHDAGIKVHRLRGAQIQPMHWDAFYGFYRSTIEQKWGHDYLKRPFFDALGRHLTDRVLLVLAEDADGKMVAGALHLLGAECLYGRLWGCGQWHDSLHYELCYYQAIELAIELGLPRVEAGAQGEHKIARGYMPTLTHSSHYLRDPGFKRAIQTMLDSERENAYISLATLATKQNPFKAAPTRHLGRQGVQIDGQRLVVKRDCP